jgi:hypothetical protein
MQAIGGTDRPACSHTNGITEKGRLSCRSSFAPAWPEACSTESDLDLLILNGRRLEPIGRDQIFTAIRLFDLAWA